MEFLDEREADEAIYSLDRTSMNGRTITVCYSREGRKTPQDMQHREREALARAAGWPVFVPFLVPGKGGGGVRW